MRRRLTAVIGVLLLAGCVAQPVKQQLPALSPAEVAAASQRQLAHEAWTDAHPDWALQGRVAVSNGRDGGSGRIEWRQHGPSYDVALSAPITRQSWRLSGDDAIATLAGLEGGPRSGPDPAALLRDATRWDIPVAALASWVRGARADESRHGPATLTYGGDGRLAHLEQAGWRIEYGAWQPGEVGALPLRLAARRDQASVRLIVDSWAADAGSAASR